MPNTLTSIFVSNPATEPVEAPHPNTGVYVTGTQATVGGPWTVVHTLITKTATPLTMVGRLKNFPAVTVSVVATGGPNAGNIFNNILATPTGTAATATSSTAINVVVSSIANQTGYRLLASDTSTGTFVQIYQGTTASFPHTGLTAAQTKFYKWQYVGGGYYDDSQPSAVFSGATAAAAAFQDLYIGDSLTTSYPQSNVLDANSYPTLAHAQLSASWGMSSALGQGYPSQTAEQVQASGLAYVTGLKLGGTTKSFVVVRAGINNLRTGQTVDAAFLALTNLCTALFNAGLFPLVCTTTINRFAGDPNQDALQADLNNRIRTLQTTLKASGVIDLGSDYRLNTNTTTYQQDGIHETAAGRQVVAAMVAQGLMQAATGTTGFVITGTAGTPLEIVDTNAAITYGAGWAEVDVAQSAGASIYRGGHTHYGAPGAVVSATYPLPQACSSIGFYLPTSTNEISASISVGAGAVLVINRPAGTAVNSSIVATLTGPFTAGQVFKVTTTAGNSTAYTILDGFVLNP